MMTRRMERLKPRHHSVGPGGGTVGRETAPRSGGWLRRRGRLPRLTRAGGAGTLLVMDSPTPASRPVLPIASIVAGGIAALLALALLVSGGALVWASSAKTDDGGWWSTDSHRLSTATRAMTTQRLDAGTDAPRWLFDSGHLAQIHVSAISHEPLFVGVGPTRKVERYLAGVGRAELADLDLDPFRATFVRRPGPRMELAAPSSQRFWAASSSGSGRRMVTWPVRRGHWSIVVMNADASPGVSVALSAGARVPFVHDLGLGLLIAGGVAGLGAGGLVALGGTRLRRRIEPKLVYA